MVIPMCRYFQLHDSPAYTRNAGNIQMLTTVSVELESDLIPLVENIQFKREIITTNISD